MEFVDVQMHSLAEQADERRERRRREERERIDRWNSRQGRYVEEELLTRFRQASDEELVGLAEGENPDQGLVRLMNRFDFQPTRDQTRAKLARVARRELQRRDNEGVL